MKIKQVDMGGGLSPSWRHWCPGCDMNHIIYTDGRAQPNGHKWTFDGNMEAPTFSPSVNIVGRCHYFIRAGRIEYCGDSKHALAGKTVDLPDLVEVGEDWD
jgi:hypothetical protein